MKPVRKPRTQDSKKPIFRFRRVKPIDSDLLIQFAKSGQEQLTQVTRLALKYGTREQLHAILSDFDLNPPECKREETPICFTEEQQLALTNRYVTLAKRAIRRVWLIPTATVAVLASVAAPALNALFSKLNAPTIGYAVWVSCLQVLVPMHFVYASHSIRNGKKIFLKIMLLFLLQSQILL